MLSDKGSCNNMSRKRANRGDSTKRNGEDKRKRARSFFFSRIYALARMWLLKKQEGEWRKTSFFSFFGQTQSATALFTPLFFSGWNHVQTGTDFNELKSRETKRLTLAFLKSSSSLVRSFVRPLDSLGIPDVARLSVGLASLFVPALSREKKKTELTLNNFSFLANWSQPA